MTNSNDDITTLSDETYFKKSYNTDLLSEHAIKSVKRHWKRNFDRFDR